MQYFPNCLKHSIQQYLRNLRNCCCNINHKYKLIGSKINCIDLICSDDFKPASVDESKVATVDVGSNNTISVTVPHLDGAGTPHTVFKGSQKPYHKEYVLIFDKSTGEITLERLSANIQVKKTRYVFSTCSIYSHLCCIFICMFYSKSPMSFRAEPKQNSNGNTLPVIAAPTEIKKSPTYGRANGRTKVISGKKREPSVQLHPKQNLHQASQHDKKSPRNTSMNRYLGKQWFLVLLKRYIRYLLTDRTH